MCRLRKRSRRFSNWATGLVFGSDSEEASRMRGEQLQERRTSPVAQASPFDFKTGWVTDVEGRLSTVELVETSARPRQSCQPPCRRPFLAPRGTEERRRERWSRCKATLTASWTETSSNFIFKISTKCFGKNQRKEEKVQLLVLFVDSYLCVYFPL